MKKPKLTPLDRLLWAWLCGVWPDWRSALIVVKPETVIAWHRKGFRLFWTWRVRRGQPGRPSVPKNVRDLIRLMSRTMAHEMGHLLLQSVTHPLAGVMKARWLAEDLTAAEGGTLAFTREEGNSMRNQLLKLKDTDPLGSNVGLAARTNTHQNQANMPARD